MCMLWSLVFFFQQKTAYEMRISDWSSDVCSSDLQAVRYVYRRDDEGEDAPEPEISDEQNSARANSCYRLLDRLRTIPGHDENGDLCAEQIVNWVEQVRAGCAAIAKIGREHV